MTLKQRREVMRKFLAGESVYVIACTISNGGYYPGTELIEAAIRSYLRGEFSLAPKRKKRR